MNKIVVASMACPTVILVAACSSGGSAAPTETVTVTTTASAASRSPSAQGASSTAAVSPPTGMKLGRAYQLPSAGLTATVLGFDKDSPGGNPDKGDRFVAVEVKVCTDKKTSVGDAPWSLVGSDDSTDDTVLNGGGLKEPEYLDGNALLAGECARGWITFEVNESQHVKLAKYSPTNGKGNSIGVALWKVG